MKTLILSFVFVVLSTSAGGTPLCDGNPVAWKKQFQSKGVNPMKNHALEGCTEKVAQTLQQQTAACEASGKVADFEPGDECQPEECRYYGKPVRAWFCYHTLTFACCEK